MATKKKPITNSKAYKVVQDVGRTVSRGINYSSTEKKKENLKNSTKAHGGESSGSHYTYKTTTKGNTPYGDTTKTTYKTGDNSKRVDVTTSYKKRESYNDVSPNMGKKQTTNLGNGKTATVTQSTVYKPNVQTKPGYKTSTAYNVRTERVVTDNTKKDSTFNKKSGGSGESHYQYKVPATQNANHKNSIKSRDSGQTTDLKNGNASKAASSGGSHYEYKDSKGTIRTEKGTSKATPTASSETKARVAKQVQEAPKKIAQQKRVETAKKVANNVKDKVTAGAKSAGKSIAKGYDNATTAIANKAFDATQTEEAKKKAAANKAKAKNAVTNAWNSIKKKVKNKKW